MTRAKGGELPGRGEQTLPLPKARGNCRGWQILERFEIKGIKYNNNLFLLER